MLSKSNVAAGSVAAGSAFIIFIVSYSLKIGLSSDVDKKEGSLKGITSWFATNFSKVTSCYS